MTSYSLGQHCTYEKRDKDNCYADNADSFEIVSIHFEGENETTHAF